MPATVTQEQIEQLVDAYVRLANVAAAAEEAGVSRTNAYYHLQARGFEFERLVPYAELTDMRMNGATYQEMADHFQVSIGTIHNWLNAMQMAGTRSRTLGVPEAVEGAA